MAEQQTKYKQLKERVMRAILSGNQDEFMRAVNPAEGRSPSEKKRLRTLLLRRQKFARLGGGEHDAQMMRAFPGLLVSRPGGRLLPVGRDPPHRGVSEVVLEDSLSRYRGYLIHVAAALDRAAMVVEMLVTVSFLGWHRAARRLLTARDSERRTLLVAAVLGGSRSTVMAVRNCVFGLLDRKAAVAVLWEAIASSTFLVHTKAVTDTVQLLTGKTVSPSHTCIYWPIHLADYGMYVSLRREQLTVPGGPPALHVAVRKYSEGPLTLSQHAILTDLMERSSSPPVAALNAVCVLTPHGEAPVSGTTVHFAVHGLSHHCLYFNQTSAAREENIHGSRYHIATRRPHGPHCEDAGKGASEQTQAASGVGSKQIDGSTHKPINRSSVGNTKQTESQQGNERIETLSEQRDENSEADPRQTDRATQTDPTQADRSTQTDPTHADRSTQTDPTHADRSTQTDPTHADRSTQTDPERKVKTTGSGSRQTDTECAPTVEETHIKGEKNSKGKREGIEVWTEAHVPTVLWTLHALRVRGADFTLTNKEGKTPLDTLPPDSDPMVIRGLVTFMRSAPPRQNLT